MAQSARVRVGSLSLDGSLSKERNVRSVSATAPRAVSIPANIAEGFRRRGKPDKARYMNIAEGSLEECRYYLILAQDLGYGDTTRLSSTAEQISRLLNAYAAAILSSDS